MTLYSNQRFSEYSQSWKYTDSNNNLLLNFKTVNRENNPQYGKIQAGLWNIPGERFYTMKKTLALDDNGSESLLLLKMKQPVAIDLMFKLSIFSTKYSSLNTFNTLINKKFAARQCYIRPNGHYMPMTLDNIDDSSDYTIDGRKFYIQSSEINIMAYIIPRDDLKVELIPKRRKVTSSLKEYEKTFVSMDFDDGDENKFILDIKFNKGVSKASFSLDDAMYLEFFEKKNANKVVMKINDEEVDINSRIRICPGDDVVIKIVQPIPTKSSEIIFNGVLNT
jgi:hypothetical protein